jgi:hypothetical protein
MADVVGNSRKVELCSPSESHGGAVFAGELDA